MPIVSGIRTSTIECMQLNITQVKQLLVESEKKVSEGFVYLQKNLVIWTKCAFKLLSPLSLSVVSKTIKNQAKISLQTNTDAKNV